MNKYYKFLVALLGALFIGLSDLFGIDIPFTPDAAVDAVLAVLAALGVYAVPNDPPAPAPDPNA